MILPLDHFAIPLVGAGLVTVIVVGVLVGFLHPPIRGLARRVVDLIRPGDGERRACRYCFLGRAHLHDETLRLDGDDLVEVRCWVCKSCGLPQWTVARTAVLKKAA